MGLPGRAADKATATAARALARLGIITGVTEVQVSRHVQLPVISGPPDHAGTGHSTSTMLTDPNKLSSPRVTDEIFFKVTESAGPTGSLGELQILHHIWLDWSRIAQQQLKSVRSTRENILETRQRGGNWSGLLSEEHKGSMVTISACAHALDGLYGALKPLVVVPVMSQNASRHDHIRGVLAEAFRVKNEDRNYWKLESTWLHDLRDAAVHPREELRPPVSHSVHGNSSYEGARYCVESCERAMKLLLNVVGFLEDGDRAKTQAVREYGALLKSAAAELLAFR